MKHSMRRKFTFRDRDGVIVNEESYQGIEGVMDQFQRQFSMRAHEFARRNTANSLDEIVLAAFIQGMVWAATASTPDEAP